MPSSSFTDGLGRRVGPDPGSIAPTESLHLCDELSLAPGAEEALRARVERLATFPAAHFAPARRIENARGRLVIVSDAVRGLRLADVLRAAERRWLEPDLRAALALLRQVTVSVACLHEQTRGLAHGSLGPERIVVCEDGSVVIVEAVASAAVERLEMSRTRLWRQFRVAVAPVAGAASLDQVTDVVQLGVLALALTTGRLLGRDDFPARLPALVREIASEDPLGHRTATPPAVRSWISRALQLDSRGAFRSALEAEAALGEALAASRLDGVCQQDVADWVSWATTGKRPERREAAPAVAAPAAASVDPGAAPSADASGPRTPALGCPLAALPATGTTTRQRAAAWRVARRAAPRSAPRPLTLVAALLVLAAGGYLGARSYLGLPPLLLPTGHLTVESLPTGLEVLLDGKPLGSTPVSAKVKAGDHTLALRSSRNTTLVPIKVQPGAWHTERIEVRRGQAPRRTSTVQGAGK